MNADVGRAHGHRKTDRSRMVGGLSDFASFGLRGMRRLFKGQEEKRIWKRSVNCCCRHLWLRSYSGWCWVYWTWNGWGLSGSCWRHFLSSLRWYCWVWSFPVSVRVLAITQSRRSAVAGCTFHARLQALWGVMHRDRQRSVILSGMRTKTAVPVVLCDGECYVLDGKEDRISKISKRSQRGGEGRWRDGNKPCISSYFCSVW